PLSRHTLLLTRPSAVFSFDAPAPTQIYTLSLHDALPISLAGPKEHRSGDVVVGPRPQFLQEGAEGQRPCVYRKPGEPISYHIQGDRKSTRLNSSHVSISYAVFCLKKKKKKTHTSTRSLTE